MKWFQRRRLRRGPTIGLVLAGGGARGAYQVGVLKAMAQIAPERCTPFEVITGVSVGAINAVSIAGGATAFPRAAARLEHLWRQLETSHVIRTDPVHIAGKAAHWLLALTLGGLGVRNPLSLLDNTPLRELLARETDISGARRAIEAGALKALAVTASSYRSGRALTFFEGGPELAEWDRARRAGVRAELSADHVMASAALPFLFQAEPIGASYFGDGALRLTTPLSPAIHLGADRIVVVGARDTLKPAGGPLSIDHPPTLGDLGGYMFDIAFNDNLDADIERARRINDTLDLVPAGRRQTSVLRPIDVLVVEPSRDIREIAGRHAQAMPAAIRALLRGVGGWGPPWQLASYLNFEPGYIAELIDLGRADALARADEIEAFLAQDAAPSAAADGAAPRHN